MWIVHNQELYQKYLWYCEKIGDVDLYHRGSNPGNQQRRFHRTSMECQAAFTGTFCSSTSCKACSILKTGFSLKYANPCPTWPHWGVGLYSSPCSSYGLNLASKGAASKFANGAVLVCKVAMGKAETSHKWPEKPTTHPHGWTGLDTTKHHSRVAASTTGNKDDAEVIVFDEHAMVPRYLLLY